MHDQYSSGPFSRVHFMLGRDGLHSYRYRAYHVEPKGTLINTISVCIYNGGPRFDEVYERMSA